MTCLWFWARASEFYTPPDPLVDPSSSATVDRNLSARTLTFLRVEDILPRSRNPTRSGDHLLTPRLAYQEQAAANPHQGQTSTPISNATQARHLLLSSVQPFDAAYMHHLHLSHDSCAAPVVSRRLGLSSFSPRTAYRPIRCTTRAWRRSSLVQHPPVTTRAPALLGPVPAGDVHGHRHFSVQYPLVTTRAPALPVQYPLVNTRALAPLG